MSPRIIAAALYIATLVSVLLVITNAKAPRVLQVVTNKGEWVPTTGPASGIGKPKATGFWLAEFTHSYTVFNNSGWKIDVASPKGGEGKVDPQGFYFYANDPDSQRYFQKRANGSLYIPQVQNTLSLATLTLKDIDKYDAVFFVGGTGAMWDFPFDKNIQRIVNQLWASKKIVSAVCHGPMALTNVMLPSGAYLVANKLMTGFSNDEEQKLGKANVCALCAYNIPVGCNVTTCDGPYMPVEYYRQGTYLLEDGLKNRSAIYVATRQDWDTFYYRPHVIKDGLLVTGQNPGAGRETAEAVVATYKLLQKKGYAVASAQLQSIFCSKVQQTAKDAPVMCQVRDYKRGFDGTLVPSEELVNIL